MTLRAAPESEVPSSLAAGRYRVIDVLGRGGMATVYRVVDTQSGQTIALKRLKPGGATGVRQEIELAFRREYHTLTHLAHPQVIEVYDYGVDSSGAYYTMELLDGGDLRAQAPMPWQPLCGLFVDICSSLSLLHSRRLVHRDVGPRNIHCNREGRAKLIDFGAVVPMGTGGAVVGTPPFVAPEVVYRLTLDARTDLFSLGATLYYGLTRKHAYHAKDFSQLDGAWKTQPVPPSALIADIPPALDALVMALIQPDPAMRPRSAYEVMQRLAAVSGIERSESDDVADAYLFAPQLVARHDAVRVIDKLLARARGGRGQRLWIKAGAGVGRTRMLDECVLSAKTLGATVLRAGAATAGAGPLACAQALVAQLQETGPPCDDRTGRRSEVGPASGPDSPSALVDALLRAARKSIVVVAVDDLERIDEPSIAVLAELSVRSAETRLLLCVTAEETRERGHGPALELIASHATHLVLEPLDARGTEQLLASVVGDVSNVPSLAKRIHDLAGGRPREVMDLLQYLSERRVLVYRDGMWSVPSEWDANQLPRSGELAFRDRVQALGKVERFIAEVHALAAHESLTFEDYRELDPELEPQDLDDALHALVAAQVLTGNGRVHAFARVSHARAVTDGLSEAEREIRHRALSRMYARRNPLGLPAMYHKLLGGLHEEAVDQLEAYAEDLASRGLSPVSQMSSDALVGLVEQLLEVATRLGRPPRALCEMRRVMLLVSVTSAGRLYADASAALLPQLTLDSGLSDHRALSDIGAPDERLQSALEAAMRRHQSLPERERVYRVDEAIKYMVQYVAISIAVASRTMDAELMASLPAHLAPFTGLSPLVHAMWQNAIAAFEMNFGAREEYAMVRTAELHELLSRFSEEELPYVGVIRNALAYGAGVTEAALGRLSAKRWADVLERDPLQRVNAAHLHKLVCLQQGDVRGAEAHRARAELLSAQANTLQMFARPYRIELRAHAAVGDLARVREIADAAATIAERHPAWRLLQQLAEGHFQRLRGDLEAALVTYGQCASASAPDPAFPSRLVMPWPQAMAGIVLVLVEMGHHAAALVRAEHALSRGRAAGLDACLLDIERALGLAEGRLCEYERASARLEWVIGRLRALEVTGLHLGAAYEARTRVAIWQGDAAAVERFASLTAQEYRYGHGSPLGALYQRLMLETREAGMASLPQLVEVSPETSTLGSTTTKTRVTR